MIGVLLARWIQPVTDFPESTSSWPLLSAGLYGFVLRSNVGREVFWIFPPLKYAIKNCEVGTETVRGKTS